MVTNACVRVRNRSSGICARERTRSFHCGLYSPTPVRPLALRDESVLERVLDFLTGLLEVGLRLVPLSLGLELLVIGGLSETFLGLAEPTLSLVLRLVLRGHVTTLSSTPGPESLSDAMYPPRR